MNDKEAIEMMQRCAAELRSLRKQVEALTPMAQAYEVIRDITRLLPRETRGYGEDLVWRLEKKITELQAQPKEPANAKPL